MPIDLTPINIMLALIIFALVVNLNSISKQLKEINATLKKFMEQKNSDTNN